MTQDEMIEMARQAGFKIGLDIPSIYAAHERFANLVAQHEREACAKVCDDHCGWTPRMIGSTIRQRGQALDYEPWTPDDMAYRPDGLPQRTWVGLTPEEIDEIIETASDSTDALLQTMDKLKQKNGNA
jgi:hypothetical protein